MADELTRALASAEEDGAGDARMAADAGRDVLPRYLQLALGETPPPETEYADVVAMKAREREEVRYRSVPYRCDLHVEAAVAPMRKDLWDHFVFEGNPDMDIGQIVEIGPVSFVNQAHRRSLRVQRLRTHPYLRAEYAEALLSDFPATVVGKVGAPQLETEDGRAKALGQLTTKHAGEVVEFDSTRTLWTLLPTSGPGSASSASEPVHPQLFCVKGGGRLATQIWAIMVASRRGAATEVARQRPSPKTRA